MSSNNKNIRTAAGFGGVGGAGSAAYSPGGSPIAKGGQVPGAYNQWIEDKSFEAILARTHNPLPDDPERNFEKRLVPMHVYKEDDIIGDLDILDPAERQRLKFRANLRKFKSELENEADNIMFNDYSASNMKNYMDKPKSFQSMEESLSKRRKYEDYKETSIVDDLAAEQIKPERYHPVLSDSKNIKKAFKDYPSNNRSHVTEEGGNDNPFYEAQFQTPSLGKELPFEGADISGYAKGLRTVATPDEDGFREFGDLVTDMPYPDTLPNFSGYNAADHYDIDEDPYIPLEQKLHPTENPLTREENTEKGSFDDEPLMQGQGNYPRVPAASV
jgi:hypothetical protein